MELLQERRRKSAIILQQVSRCRDAPSSPLSSIALGNCFVRSSGPVVVESTMLSLTIVWLETIKTHAKTELYSVLNNGSKVLKNQCGGHFVFQMWG